MEIRKICVYGGGVMGRQIALNAAIYGYPAAVYTRRQEVHDEVVSWMETYMDGRIKKGRLTEEQVSAAKAIFKVTTDLKEALEDVDCVVECVSEVEETKKAVFRQVSELIDDHVIIATNSSYMVSSRFTDCVKHPDKLANMHFYNPALVMKFVEIVQGPHTSEETARALYEFCEKTGKMPIWMKKEIPGFAANYIISGIYERARYLVEGGYCSYQDVDKACEYGLNHPMGPFRLNDLTGVDLTYDIMKAGYEKTGVKPACYDLYESMVKQGRLGRKTGHGFYDYE